MLEDVKSMILTEINENHLTSCEDMGAVTTAIGSLLTSLILRIVRTISAAFCKWNYIRLDFSANNPTKTLGIEGMLIENLTQNLRT